MDVYFGLFVTAFVSATLLPGVSEAAILVLLHEGYDITLLWLVATTGNSLGSVVNYVLGRYLLRFEQTKWFPFKKEKLKQSQAWFQRYGRWSMLLAWLPLVGDGLTFIAGMMKMNFALFAVLVTLGKAARYAVILGLLSLYF